MEPVFTEWEITLGKRLLIEALEARSAISALTPRQIEVGTYIAKGYTPAEAADFLKVTEGMVRRHVEDSRSTLKLRSRLELAVLFAKAGIS